MENVHLESAKQQTEMRSKLKQKQLQSMHQQMTEEAHNLATALKGQKKMQGNWGELVLENVLDRSGLQPGKDYKREASFTNDDGGRSRPDVVVYLPRKKHLVIDATALTDAARKHGLLIGKGGRYGNVIRIAPHLNVAADDIATGCELLERALAEVP